MKVFKLIILSFLLTLLLFIWFTIANKNDITKYKVVSGFDIKEYKIIDYDDSKQLINIAITPTSNAKECGLLEGENKVVFKKIEDNTCYITNKADSSTVYFKDSNNHVSKAFVLNNYVFNINLKDRYYLPINTTIDVLSNIEKIGNPNIEIKADNDNVEIFDNKIITSKEGTTRIDIISNGEIIKTTTIVATDAIISRPEEFNLDKPYLACNEYNGEKAKLLDEILQYRMKEVGENTRASVVEAARFLTLEFPRRIPYYWENGRLFKTGRHYVDGEGRYYHKGLYLSEDKYNDIVASMQGPKMWGCKMINWQDDPPDFIRNEYYPNGLDCSGFVSWVLLNGGFDIGDKGAGPVGGSYDLTDLGEFKYITNSLIDSGTIKVGDLLSTSGHIAILIGIDDEHFYVAESLNHYGGVVMRKYRKTRITGFFQNVVMMDNIYKEDGKLTNMWY